MLRGALLAAALLTLVGFGGRQSSAASASPRNGRIAFDHIGEAGGAQIYR